MPVIGCDIPVRVGGTEIIGAKAGVWLKTHFREEGHYLVATTYLVAAGNPTVFELRIDLRPLEKAALVIHQALHQKMTPTVGFSFSKAWRSVKKTAKKIGKSKLIKAVGKVTNSVVKSKITGSLVAALAVVVPPVGVPALAAYGAANAAIKAVDEGRKLVKTAGEAKKIVDKGTAIAKRAVTTPQPNAAAQAAVKAKAKASPVVQKALAVKKRLADPKVKTALLTIKTRADSAKKALDKVAYDSQHATGSKKVDAQKSRAILNLVAANNLRLAAIAQRNAGGLPALLIDPKGKITRGKYTVKAQAAGHGKADLLYLGPGQVQRGLFTKVAGSLSDLVVGSIGSLSDLAIGSLSDLAIGTSRPPPRPRDRERENVIRQWLLAQEHRGKLARISGCYPVPGAGRNLRVSGDPFIGCATNMHCACDAPGV